MNKILLVAVMLSIASVSAIANAKQEVDVKRTIWEISDFPELEKSAKDVCGGKLVLSTKLQVACKEAKFPSVTKAGKFRNTGIGAELNALIAQTSASKQ